ncbi:recombinase family protein [Bosea sp. 2RAB26]|uniref:recombinase family protein n=1 Tax=Bosea sp. 2RAB26 TaxID=3237476 RepID=UPI003F8F8ABB
MTPHHGKFISYLRVSTKRQGESGLGLEAQRASVTSFLNGGNWQLVEEHVEVESGKHDHNRPALHAALEACKIYGATLVIAKLDRLSRDAHFLLGLQKAGVKFVAADMPEANEMVVGIMALVAQAERRMISERTKAALAAATARGKRLGKPKGYQISAATSETRARGSAATAANAQVFAQRLRPVFAELTDLSANAAAIELNRRGIATARGGVWSAVSVINLRTRLEG